MIKIFPMPKLRNLFFIGLSLALSAGFLCHAVLAADITFEASVNKSRVPLGSTVQLTLAVRGTETTPAIETPDIANVQVRYLGPSTQITIINGQYSRTNSYIYSLYPSQVGKFTVP